MPIWTASANGLYFSCPAATNTAPHLHLDAALVNTFDAANRSTLIDKAQCGSGARVQMTVHDPADHLLLTIDPLISTSRVSSRIKHTITLLDPAQGGLQSPANCLP